VQNDWLGKNQWVCWSKTESFTGNQKSWNATAMPSDGYIIGYTEDASANQDIYTINPYFV